MDELLLCCVAVAVRVEYFVSLHQNIHPNNHQSIWSLETPLCSKLLRLPTTTFPYPSLLS